MRHFQPTVRQLPPLGRRYDADQVDVFASDAETGSADPTLSAPVLSRRRRWLAARARQTT